MKKYKKILETILGSILFGFLPFVAVILISSKFPFFGIRSFVVLTGSMQPVLPIGSIIFTHAYPVYAKDDIVTFQIGDEVITHRIFATRENGYQTKGDANNTPDSKIVEQSSIIGQQVFFIPFIGRLIVFVKTLPGFLLLIILPTLLFIAFELKNLKKEFEKEIEKKLLKRMESNPSI